jgi:hypothetical protein
MFLVKRRPTLIVATLILVTAHRLLAPIQEVPESPTPAPKIEPIETPRAPKAKPKPKPKSEASASPTNPAKQSPSSKQSRFAGTWVGTIPAFPTGAQDTILTVDSKETTMTHLWVGHGPTNVAKAEIVGDTMRVTFHTNVAFIFSITPMPDGVTANVRLQAFLNDGRAMFQRKSP